MKCACLNQNFRRPSLHHVEWTPVYYLATRTVLQRTIPVWPCRPRKCSGATETNLVLPSCASSRIAFATYWSGTKVSAYSCFQRQRPFYCGRQQASKSSFRHWVGELRLRMSMYAVACLLACKVTLLVRLHCFLKNPQGHLLAVSATNRMRSGVSVVYNNIRCGLQHRLLGQPKSSAHFSFLNTMLRLLQRWRGGGAGVLFVRTGT